MENDAPQVATMFTLYECAGVVTNLAAGFAGARWGIRFTLVLGLCLQLLTYGMLYGWQEEWEQGEAILYVTISQVGAWCMHAWCMHGVHTVCAWRHVVHPARGHRSRCSAASPRT